MELAWMAEQILFKEQNQLDFEGITVYRLALEIQTIIQLLVKLAAMKN